MYARARSFRALFYCLLSSELSIVHSFLKRMKWFALLERFFQDRTISEVETYNFRYYGCIIDV